jgi:hypothetical protein
METYKGGSDEPGDAAEEVPRIAEEFGLSEDDVREAIIVGRVLSFASASKRKIVDSPRVDVPTKETRDALTRVVGEIYLAIARAIGIQGKALTIVEQYYRDMDVVEIEWEVETLGDRRPLSLHGRAGVLAR